MTLCAAALDVLLIPDPVLKAEQTREQAAQWRQGLLQVDGEICTLPDRPARPAQPVLLHPGKVPKRKIGIGPEGRIALLHALAHIELNAIDLAWDIVGRFVRHSPALPKDFFDDWVSVADDEARHFLMLHHRLNELGAAYGDLPAHDGLWQAAQATANDLQARLAVVPMVLEARGLDVTPAMINRLKKVGDDQSADILTEIHDDEITHVSAGTRWFHWLCDLKHQDPETTWRKLVEEYFRGDLKPPFNRVSRSKANFPERYYNPSAAG